MAFYTSIALKGNKILVKGYDKGLPFDKVVYYKPYLFLPNKQGDYKTIDGIACSKKIFDNINDAREFVSDYGKAENFKFYGSTNYLYNYIYDYYPGEIEYDPSVVKIVTLDIEVAADQGFPSIRNADKEITAITLRSNGYTCVFGCGDYTPTESRISYVKCKHEAELLSKFIDVWSSDAWMPDIITGWNVEFFDIPYIVNRITRVLGPKWVKNLSPWGMVDEEIIRIADRENQTYSIGGMTILDYLALYRKFSFSNSESYKLDYIANAVLGEKKVDYSEYGSLLELYKKNYQKFIEYNIIDCVLVDKLEDKLNFIKQVLAIAYDAKTTYKDTFTTVRAWDTIIANFLMNRNIVIPMADVGEEEEQIVGGYVKDPQVGMHKWVISFDLNSLYPHLIMQYNISPETFAGKVDGWPTIDKLLEGDNKLPDENFAYTAMGCAYRKDVRGFLPELMQKFYDDRVVYKEKMLEAKKLYEKTKEVKYDKDISRFHNMQMAKKIQLNSAYGALANRFFRWYSRDMAESITSSGQLSIRWMEQAINKRFNKTLGTTNFDYVIACDTDSMYINMGPVVDQMGLSGSDAEIARVLDQFCQNTLEPFIDKQYDKLACYMSAYEQKMKMKRECIANKGIWTAKKRYILNVFNQEGVEYKEPKLKIQGLEAVRSSTPTIVREKIKQTISVIVNEGEEATRKFITDFKEQFVKMPFVDVAFPRGVKGMSKYKDSVLIYKKATPIHVKAALLYNHMLIKHDLQAKYQPIYEGDKIKYAYLKEPNPAREGVIAALDELPQQFDLSDYIDYETQFDKTYLEPMKTIFNIIGWQIEIKESLYDLFD